MKYIYILLLTIFSSTLSYGQTGRISKIKELLDTAAKNGSPGLNEKVDISVSGVNIKEFIRGIALSQKLNITVENDLNFNIVNNFSKESVSNILIYLCEQYNLDLKFFGSIITVSNFKNDIVENKLKIEYNAISNKISFDIDNQPLDLVTKELTIRTGKNIIVGDPSLNNYIARGFIKDVYLKNGIDKFAFVNNLVLDTTKDGFYIISKPITSTKDNSSDKNSINFKTSPNLNYLISYDSLGNHLISLQAIDIPTNSIIKLISKECKKSYISFAEPIGNTSAVFSYLTFDAFLGFLLNNTNITYRKEGNVYVIGDRKSEGLRMSKIHKMKYRSAKEIVDIIPAELKVNVEVKPFPELNSILLSGSEPNINEIQFFLTAIDQIVPVIMIDLIVIDVNKSYTITTGIKAGFGDSTKKTQGQLLPNPEFNLSSQSLNNFLRVLNGTGVFNLGQINDNSVYLSLKALEDRGDVNIRSNPRLSTLNGHKATLKIGQKQYYLIQTQNVIGSQVPQTIITNQYIPVEANLSVDIDPIVSDDNQVTMSISVEFSSFLGKPPVNAPPPTATRQFQSVIRVKDQDMIILGGLEEVQKSETGSGVPFLSRIPILKWFFSQKTKSKTDSKLIIIIRPTIIR